MPGCGPFASPPGATLGPAADESVGGRIEPALEGLHRRSPRGNQGEVARHVRKHVLVAGDAEARVADERGRLTAGDLAVIPAMVPHGVVNVGSETVKVVGFFSESEIISTFNEPVQPFGAAVLNQGAPPPAPSGATTGSASEPAGASG